MNIQQPSGNKKSVMTGWVKVSYEDVLRIPMQTGISYYANSLVKEFAKNLCISEARFIEIAITSATIGSNNWNFAARRFERVRKERIYLKMLRGRLIKRQNKESQEIKPKDSELRELFEKIVNDGIHGRELERLLNSKGLAFTSKNITYDEIEDEEEED